MEKLVLCKTIYYYISELQSPWVLYTEGWWRWKLGGSLELMRTHLHVECWAAELWVKKPPLWHCKTTLWPRHNYDKISLRTRPWVFLGELISHFLFDNYTRGPPLRLRCSTNREHLTSSWPRNSNFQPCLLRLTTSWICQIVKDVKWVSFHSC